MMKYAVTIVLLLSPVSLLADEEIPRIKRRIPPPGIELPAEHRDALTAKLAELKQLLTDVRQHEGETDAAVLLKAVDFALRHGEFYNEKEIPRAYKALELAEQRIEHLGDDATPWRRQRGLVVRGYRSKIDDSAQPYGLVIPDDVDFDKPVPLYVWLHGRGDKITDLHFIHQRLTNKGRIQPPGAIVLHPFGRHCMGFKSAGEIDVLDAIEHVASEYNIDRDRIVLMGFSMGGAGAWHIGAHYPGFVAMSPGAGFAETLRYNKLNADDFPWYERRLWGLYDVPNYSRNLFNLPVVAYSGENDKQIQAARVMEEAFRDHGRELPHIIGPGMGHNYHPDSLKEIMRRMERAAKKGLDTRPSRVSLQTQTLAYSRRAWVEVTGLKEHWRDSRVDAELTDENVVRITTTNVSHLSLSFPPGTSTATIRVDGAELTASWPDEKSNHPRTANFSLTDKWQLSHDNPHAGLRKRPRIQGPIDDAFTKRFVVVTPTGKSRHPQVHRWVEFELAHFLDRWRALYRGEPRVMTDVEYLASFDNDTTLEEPDLIEQNVIAWGDPSSNRLLSLLFSSDGLPIGWNEQHVTVGEQSFSSSAHVPVFVYPRGNSYIVVNSGPTHREGHDRTNSLQNPKLPDWAIIDLSQLPNAEAPGRVAAADFFDEKWQLKTTSTHE